MTPARILVKALSSIDSTRIGVLARDLGIPRAQVRRAANGAHGQPTRADYHLQICAYLGVDPITGAAIDGGQGALIRFDAALFGMGVKMRRFERKQAAYEAAKAAKLSATLYSRICNALPVSFESLLRCANAAKLDPRIYTVPVPRETLTRKPLTPQENRSAA